MKNCKEVRELISLYIDGELDDSQLSEFENHIGECDACKAELNEIKAVMDLCRDIEEVELPENFRDELHRKLVQVKSEQDTKNRVVQLRNRYIKIFSTIAAGLLLVVFAKGFYDRGLFAPVKSDMSARNEAQMEAPQAAFDRAESVGADEAKSEAKAAESSISAKQEAVTSEGAPKESARATVDEPRKLKMASTPETTAANRNSEIAVNVADNSSLDELTDKIKSLALENGAEFNLAVEESRQAPGVVKQMDNGSDASAVRTLNFKVPNVQYDSFVSRLTESLGQSNVQVVDMRVEDLTARVNELNSRLAEIDASINETANNGKVSDPQKLDEIKNEREAVAAEIERIQFDSDFTFVNIVIREIQ